MGDTWTNEQRQAIYTRNCNLLVAAAAGSGKTAVLVERIIKMLTEGDELVDIDKLLVVTFTNAAAAEMRERIGDAISKALEEKPDSEILQRQLSLLNRANITTMHAFCLNVIKSNYHLLDLDPGFRIGDEAEISILKDDVISDLLEDKYEEAKSEYLNLIEAFAQGRDDNQIKEEILKLYSFIMSGPWPEKWLTDKANDYDIKTKEELSESIWIKTIVRGIKLEFDNIKRIYSGLLEVCRQNSWLASYEETLQDDYYQIETVFNALNSNDIEQIYDAIFKVKFTRIKTISKKLVEDDTLKNSIKDSRDDVKKKIGKLQEKVPAEHIDDILAGINSMYPFVKELGELVIEFKARFEAKKREKNLLDFNDIEHLCLKILISGGYGTDNPKPSAIAKEFKDKFVEVLVDEYQDSSSIQETIIDMVSRRKDENPNTFMVGDVKQSIYKFRQAKPELFLEKYNTYSTLEGVNKKIMLFKNFRSRKEILSAANYVFETLMSEIVGELEYDERERLNLGIPYEEIEDNVEDKEHIGEAYNSLETELHIFDKNGVSKIEEKNEDEKKESDDEEEDLEDSQFEARIIAKRIKEMISEKDGKTYVVWDKSLKRYRKLKYKDIVILLRATKNWSAGIVEELGREGIPVYADTGTGYFDTTEIRTIMSLLNIIDNPMQDIYVIASLRTPIFSFTAEELGEVRLVDKEKYFYENIIKIYNHETEISEEIEAKCIYFIDKLREWRDKAEYMPIDELIWMIYTDTSYYGYVGAMPNGVQRQANLKILFQRAKQYEETSFKGVFNFINFIKKMRKSSSNDLGAAKILGENEDVVRIMSIHKSKGLEFPVVFLAGTGKRFNMLDLNKTILYHEELGIGVDVVNLETQNIYSGIPKNAIRTKAELEILSEEMRILYVALTRAREKLIITGCVKDIDKTFNKWYEAGLQSETEKIEPSYLIGRTKSYLEWIGMSLSKHPDGTLIRRGKEILNNENTSKWSLKTWTKSDIADIEKVEIEVKDNLDLDKDEIEISRRILDRLDFKYKFIDVCNVPSNISVSDLKKKDMENEDTLNLFDDKELEEFNLDKTSDDNKQISEVDKLPSFMREKKGITAAEKGTIMHFIMQHVDFDKIHVNDIKKLIDKMVIKELLTDEEASSVNPYKISGFFRSNLGKRLLKARDNGFKIYRELPFFREYKVIDLYDNLDKEVYKDEMVRLQGIIDCFFEDEDGVVLVDYKSDFVIEGEEDTILDRYKVQIELYKETLERILQKEVKDKYLYLFGLDREVKY